MPRFAWAWRKVAEYVVKLLAQDAKWRNLASLRPMASNPSTPSMRGRRKQKRLESYHITWLKSQIQNKFKVDRRFYEAVFNETKKREYALYDQPKYLDSVSGAFACAFRGERPLPAIYSAALCVVLNIDENSLPWRKDKPKEDLGPKATPQAEHSSGPSPNSTAIPLWVEVPCKPTGYPLRDKLTPDLFRGLTIPEIKGCIVAALMEHRAPDGVPETESLLPEAIHVLAEKLVRGSVDDFVDFYYGDYDSPPHIKREVGALICANRILRGELAAKVVRSGADDLAGWFSVFSFWCSHEMMVEVEREFLKFEKEQSFQEQYGGYRSHWASCLMEQFSKFGCVSAVSVLNALIR